MLMFFAVGLVALRYFALGQARDAMRPGAHALRRFAGVVLFQLIITAGVLHARGLLALAGLPATGITPLRVTLSLLQQLIEPLLFLWYVNAAVGTRGFGPVASARTTGALWFWALAPTFLTRLPLNAAHQLLNRVPASQGPVLLWSALAVDAVVVVLIAGSLAAIQVRIARHIAARRGVALLAEAA